VLSAAFLRGNGVIHRTQKLEVIQVPVYDNGHVGPLLLLILWYFGTLVLAYPR
jgi:hypothetical protein